MTTHDTYIFLATPSPYDPIKPLFPQGFPMRDPFPMGAANADGQTVALWLVDLDKNRLSDLQFDALGHCIADHVGATILEVVIEARERGGFAIDSRWVERMVVGPEGYARANELTNFLAEYAQPTTEAITNFHLDQQARWIDGREIPPPLPQTIEEVPVQLRSPELAAAIQQNWVNQSLASGKYSVMDVLSGKAMVELLNAADPDNDYELVGLDDVEPDND